MDSGFTIEAVPVDSYTLIINHKYRKGEMLAAYYVTFYRELEKGVKSIDFVGQLKEHLSELLDNLKEDEWTPENIQKVITELMCENPLSHMSFEYNDLEYKRILFYVKDYKGSQFGNLKQSSVNYPVFAKLV